MKVLNIWKPEIVRSGFFKNATPLENFWFSFLWTTWNGEILSTKLHFRSSGSYIFNIHPALRSQYEFFCTICKKNNKVWKMSAAKTISAMGFRLRKVLEQLPLDFFFHCRWHKKCTTFKKKWEKKRQKCIDITLCKWSWSPLWQVGKKYFDASTGHQVNFLKGLGLQRQGSNSASYGICGFYGISTSLFFLSGGLTVLGAQIGKKCLVVASIVTAIHTF